MIDIIKKMEIDVKDGMAYSSAICLEDKVGESDKKCEQPASKQSRQTNNTLTMTRERQRVGCRCGGEDHQPQSAHGGGFHKGSLLKITSGGKHK
jgi:hypothetical protein